MYGRGRLWAFSVALWANIEKFRAYEQSKLSIFSDYLIISHSLHTYVFMYTYMIVYVLVK